MIKGTLVINEFLKGGKYDEIHTMLVSAFRKKGCELTIKTNAQLMPVIDGNAQCTILNSQFNNSATPPSPCAGDLGRFVVFFDKDILLAEYLESRGLRLFNPSAAIAACDDKRLTALRLSGKIKMPRTVIAPMTYDNIGFTNYDFLDDAAKTLGFPLVVKEAFGSFGKQVYLVNDMKELKQCVRSAGTKLLFQELITSSFGRDVRVQVVGGKVIASVLRTGAPGSFISNVTGGGKMEYIKADKPFEETAVEACRLLGLDFGGVDLLFGNGGEPVLCEINSNAHFKNLLDACGINAADVIADYVLNAMRNS